jgi:hypothetical protein
VLNNIVEHSVEHSVEHICGTYLWNIFVEHIVEKSTQRSENKPISRCA